MTNQPNLTTQLISLISDVDSQLDMSPHPSPELLEDIESLRAHIEELFQGWKEPAEGVAYAIEELDEYFEFAGEEFLQVCDHLEEALVSREPECLDDASRSLRKAGFILRSADSAAAERFANWESRSQGANPNLFENP